MIISYKQLRKFFPSHMGNYDIGYENIKAGDGMFFITL